jgi:hypothetical protein
VNLLPDVKFLTGYQILRSAVCSSLTFSCVAELTYFQVTGPATRMRPQGALDRVRRA